MSEDIEIAWTDPVRVIDVWIATCDDCGWHCPAAEPQSVVREWARLHRVTCLLKRPAGATDV